MKDLLVLEEMEYNGSKYDVELSKSMGAELEHKLVLLIVACQLLS
jgi:hypothetical protein